ncbi:chondroitin sulfate proteoglycan 4-like protein [Lycorma delicatula]|uniref:chondroitin sulfate proteoglycan 4-like protein n=1 Tax=Lycorma delicatula TaxID=130591 RepID=UPI003F514C8D
MILLWLFFLFPHLRCSFSETASFYGSSYVSVPLQDAKSVTEVQLRFRTKRSDALLFLAAGRIDYCLIRLESGRLKMHINLGAGEVEISSPKGLRLNDLQWHDVLISRKEADVMLQVDHIHTTRKKLPGNFFELNIHYGLFVGGQGEFSELFLGHGEWLRGCLGDVTYNGVDVLSRARHRIGQADAQGVTWNCAAEFDADEHREISFIEDGAYIALPNVISRSGAKWQFNIKTIVDHGVILYTSGTSGGKADFVGVELVNGKPRIVLDKGNGPVELSCDVSVSDGQWHTLMIHFTPSIIEISVDGKLSSMKLTQGGSRHFDLAELVHIGGIELNKRARALGQGLRTADTSYKGCLKELDVDGRILGIPQAKITQGILPDCVWQYPCKTQEPCIPEATCLQLGVNSFHCDCDRPHCVNQHFTNSYKVFSKASLLELVEITPLHVSENENALITPSHINVILDYAKYGVRDSGVLFYSVDSPKHGRLAVEVWERGNSNQIFTLLDLSKDKVRYVHDGSESIADSIELELELAPGSGFVLPGYLQGRHRLMLHVEIEPINDPPVLLTPASKVLRLAQGTRKQLTEDLLNATDPDTGPESLVYNVLDSGVENTGGQIELFQKPGEMISTFTQTDVNSGHLVYAHTATSTGDYKLPFQVSDGMVTSAAAILRVSVFPLIVRPGNNTGAVLTHHSWVRIMPANLSFTTNADDPTLSVIYQIEQLPEFGWIQRQSTLEEGEGEGTWQNVGQFSSQHLALGQIRYKHNQGSPTQDTFKFKVSVLDVHPSTVYDFRLTFTELHLSRVHNSAVLMDKILEASITSKHLSYTTTPLPVNKQSITYEVVGLPRYGVLSVEDRPLRVGQQFTQADIDSKSVSYRMQHTAYSVINDGLAFRVSAPQCQALPPATILFNHTPSTQTTNKITVTLNKLMVQEGGHQFITKSVLWLSVPFVKSLRYELSRRPLHGWIDVLNTDSSAILRPNISYFSPQELGDKRIRYTHDDSETQTDSFEFVAVSPDNEDFLYVGELVIQVNLTNDNAPVRAVESVFRVVKSGERLLTGQHLKYIDKDIDCTPNDIVYTRRGIPNGGIYSAEHPSTPIFQFTQADLDDGKVLFRHEGDVVESRVSLRVSDGVHHGEGALDVRASPPYAEIVNNTRLVVRQGGAAPITSYNLFAETNVNLPQDQVRYEILNGPSQGLLEVGGTDAAQFFTQSDIKSGRVAYRHNGDVTSVQDNFKFRVTVDTASSPEIQFNIRVFPAGYWDPLIVTVNQSLHVEESTSVTLSNKYLQVKQPHVPSSDITFLVVEPPRFGYLELESPGVGSGRDDDQPHQQQQIIAFDQAAVDLGRLHYVQAAANQTADHMILDVTNGITWLRGLVVQFVVVPDKLYIGGGELHCEEGGNVTLPPSLLLSMTDYYTGRLTEYKLITGPSYGRLISSALPLRTLNKWTPQLMQSGLIQYVHDGSESDEDVIEIIAKAGEKESQPAHIHFIISSVNDEPPVVVNNTGLFVWRGGKQLITSEHLAAVDKDTPPENVTYAIISATAGYVAFVNHPNVSIDKFTQAHINSYKVVFVHSGEEKDGEFDVVLSDGVASVGPVVFNAREQEASTWISANVGLHVFPLLRKPITSSLLHAECSDPSRTLIYHLTRSPALGHLILHPHSNPTLLPTSSPLITFSQDDINNNRVWYQHTTPLSDMTANDSFTFDLTASFTQPLTEQEFHIEISVWSGGLDQFLDLNTSLNVDEGGSTVLSLNTSAVLWFLSQHVGLSSPGIQLHLLSPPQHGSICLGANCTVTYFTHMQVDSGQVIYQHDHSDTIKDELKMSIYLEPGEVLLCNITLPVIIKPINDQPFRLVTQVPHATIVQGQQKQITRDDLLTEDDDTPPEDIVYDVISGPGQGSLLLNGNVSGRFTQADINSGKLVYEHSGPLQPVSFYFRVWDGKFNPTYTVFNIAIIPVTLNVTIANPVLLQQGSSVTAVTNNIVNVITNGKEENIVYNITSSPRHGTVYVDDVPAITFKHSDLTGRRVMYMQTDMTTHSDSFQLAASSSLPTQNSPSVTDLWVNVSVEPLLKLGKFIPLAGIKNQLTTETLDAGPLAKLTGSDPIFKILKRPRFGRIKKIIRSSGERRTVKEKEVNRFTHEEIRSGVIYYVARRVSDTVRDGFPFLLAASIFQPAIGELRFDLIGETASPPTTFIPLRPRLPGPKAPVGHEGGVEMASPNMSDDYLLVVSMVVGTIVLAILLVILVRCGSKRSESASTGEKSDFNAPLPLPRPPDDLMPSSPLPKRAAGTVPVSGAVPQCKVIPLGPTADSVMGSEPELNLRYPYGAPDEDWSSYEASEVAYPQQQGNNPMLRRNQYWV